MPNVTVGIVLHCDPELVDKIRQDMENLYDADIVFIKQSWGKLWIKEGDAP